jgi:2,4-dienoyl-CoA reductase-like NADH-dependent reductase (Old Yellow Enzyme family)
MRSNVSDEFIIGLRFSQWKQQDYSARLADNPDDLLKVLSGPCDAGLDYLHSSMRRFWEGEFEGSDENLAYWTKKLTNIPTISVGSVGLDGDFTDMMSSAKTTSIDKALKDIDEQKYDMVAVGRALLSDHEWVIKMKEGRLKDIKPYTKESLLEMY